MLGVPPITLVPFPIQVNQSIFHEICRWQFKEEFVGNILKDDIPQRI